MSKLNNRDIIIYPMQIMQSKELAENYFCQFTRAKLEDFTKLTDSAHIIELLRKNHFSTHYSVSPLGFNNHTQVITDYWHNRKTVVIDFTSKVVTAYENENGKIIPVTLMSILTDIVTIEDLLKKASDKSDSTYIFITNFVLSHYLLLNDYKGFSDTINFVFSDLINSTKDVYKNEDNEALINISFNHNFISYSSDIRKRRLNEFRAHLFLYNALIDNKIKINVKVRKELEGKILKNFVYMSENDNVEIIYSNKVLKMLMTKFAYRAEKAITKNFNSSGRSFFKQSSYFSSQVVNITPEYLESSATAVETLLLMMPIDINEEEIFWSPYNYIRNKNDSRIRNLDVAFNEDTECFVKIFKNYLYSKYAKNQKINGLEDRIRQIQHLIQLLDLDEKVNVLTIIEDLPDKIKTHALAAVL